MIQKNTDHHRSGPRKSVFFLFTRVLSNGVTQQPPLPQRKNMQGIGDHN